MRISDWSSDVCSSDLPAAVAREPHADAIRSTCGDGIPAFRRALGEPDSRFGRAPLHAWQAHQETTGHKPPVNGDAMESQELRRAGLKVTHPRMRILELLEQRSAHHHMTAEDIYRHLLDSGDENEIGRATV